MPFSHGCTQGEGKDDHQETPLRAFGNLPGKTRWSICHTMMGKKCYFERLGTCLSRTGHHSRAVCVLRKYDLSFGTCGDMPVKTDMRQSVCVYLCARQRHTHKLFLSLSPCLPLTLEIFLSPIFAHTQVGVNSSLARCLEIFLVRAYCSLCLHFVTFPPLP